MLHPLKCSVMDGVEVRSGVWPDGVMAKLRRLVGQITSGIWSPTLGQAIALT
jgi:glycine cleavage system aminomethyltransferase T